jgi:hypothetical protein
MSLRRILAETEYIVLINLLRKDKLCARKGSRNSQSFDRGTIRNSVPFRSTIPLDKDSEIASIDACAVIACSQYAETGILIAELSQAQQERDK